MNNTTYTLINEASERFSELIGRQTHEVGALAPQPQPRSIFISNETHQRPYVENQETIQELMDIRAMLDALRLLPVSPGSIPMKKRMLNNAIWQVAHATGDLHSRYRSERVIHQTGLTIQRDHIWEKKKLVEELMGPAADLDSIMARAVCCVVTTDEHDRLPHRKPNLDGWARYRAAGIVVYDMLRMAPMPETLRTLDA